MRLRNAVVLPALVAFSLLGITFCGSDETKNTYASTSTKGDFAQWTIDGDNLSGTWQVMDGSGNVQKTLTIAAACGAPEAEYGYRTCSITSASCANGTGTCAASDAPAAGATFYSFEVPGTALFVRGTGAGDEQLHVGYVLDTSCSGVAGDYSFLHMGNRQTDLFGLYRVDATFSSILHADFGITSATCSGTTTNSGNCSANDSVVRYTTGGGTGNGTATTTNNTCNGGVRTMTLGSDTVRAVQSQSGVFILDLPAGDGGLIAFKTTTAATLADFAGKNFGGITFPDNSGPLLMKVSTSAVSGANVPISSISFKDENGTPMSNAVITSAATTSVTSNPAFPNFSATPAGTYSNNALASTYANAAAIPGLFKIDGTYSDRGRVVMMASKVNGKVLGFGAVYNWRNPADSGFSGLPNGQNYYNTGAFILFEK